MYDNNVNNIKNYQKSLIDQNLIMQSYINMMNLNTQYSFKNNNQNNMNNN